MRIAFDLDDTLIPMDRARQQERLPFPLQLFYAEGLRPGSRRLLKRLRRDGHELWIYTTSHRSAFYIRSLFALMGIRLGGVVNQDRHLREVKPMPIPGHRSSKYPPAFGIDILIDDSEGVLEEGRRYDFAVIRVDPSDEEWVETVLRGLG